MQLCVIVATLEGCSFAHLNDPKRIEWAMKAGVQAGGFTLLHHHVHPFEPQGVTGSAVLSESHINLHSWPEDGCLFVDIATCGDAAATKKAFDAICEVFSPTHIKHRNLKYATEATTDIPQQKTWLASERPSSPPLS